MDNNYVTWEGLVQFCAMLTGFASFLYMIFHNNKRK